AMYVDFGLAKERDGNCYLRYDDTNPEAEEQEYIDHVLRLLSPPLEPSFALPPHTLLSPPPFTPASFCLPRPTLCSALPLFSLSAPPPRYDDTNPEAEKQEYIDF
ncbi:unnamed protein product, partial [Closterium sp. NIES-53]